LLIGKKPAWLRWIKAATIKKYLLAIEALVLSSKIRSGLLEFRQHR
jgi:hypothetical protein